MAKFKLKKPSKRQPARQRYKIEKKIRQHNRKVKKIAKNSKKKQSIVQIPNVCPFKQDILKEVEDFKKAKTEEINRKREELKIERQRQKELEKNGGAANLETLVAKAESRGTLHENLTPSDDTKSTKRKNRQEQSLKQYYKEFKKVIESADVILEVVDARDPLGTRCVQVEKAVRELGSDKRLVLILNKADLIPREVLEKWMKYLKQTVLAIPFKASTQNQSKNLGQRKFSKNVKGLQGSACVGAELLMSLLGNYCRNKGIKTSIRVGVVGLPNVGKSSLINSLKRSKACNVGATPGVTRCIQEVQLDSKIKLLDSPGIVFSSGSDSVASLRNAIKISSLADPITPACAILQRVDKKMIMEMYDMPDFKTPEEFFSVKATRTGKFKKGGLPDSEASARGLLEDWNSGKIKYYTVPPEIEEKSVHLSAAIIAEEAKEFDLDKLDVLEVDFSEKKDSKGFLVVDSLGPVEGVEDKVEEMEQDEENSILKDKVVEMKNVAEKKTKPSARLKKPDPEMELEGNQKLNKMKKLQFKKEKKQRNRRERVASQLSAGLENFTLKNNDDGGDDDDYDFEEDFKVVE